MENNLKWIVYCTTCTINKKIYIGVHRTNPDIFDGYIGNGCYINNSATFNKTKTRFQKAVKKYGPENFIRSIIAVFDNEQDAYSLEADIVNEEFLKRQDIYNLALGGKFGGQIVQRIPCYLYNNEGILVKEFASYLEASKSLSRNLKTIQRAIKNRHKCNGYFITNIKYDKLDLSIMHQYEGPNKIPVFQYNQDGEYECYYESIKEAAKILNFNDTSIGTAIKLSILYKNKYFTSEYVPKFDIKNVKHISQEIHQYDLNGKYIASYKNMQQAKNILGIKNNIYRAIKLNQLCGGYQWKFEKFESIDPVKAKSGRTRKVGKYDENWNLIKEYKSLAECKRENGPGMEHVLSGRDTFAKGYRYKYLS